MKKTFFPILLLLILGSCVDSHDEMVSKIREKYPTAVIYSTDQEQTHFVLIDTVSHLITHVEFGQHGISSTEVLSLQKASLPPRSRTVATSNSK